MSKLISIGTALPAYRQQQSEIAQFMKKIYGAGERNADRLAALYARSGIAYRYTTIPDYGLPQEKWTFYPQNDTLEPFPDIQARMQWYRESAAPLAEQAIYNCLPEGYPIEQITHLITVSCTGMSAPGLDIELLLRLKLPKHCTRTSVNFMGCYAALHALKMANDIAGSNPHAQVLIVAAELCTLHFQKEPTPDNITSSLLFGDGAAAVLVVGNEVKQKGFRMLDFYSEIAPEGRSDMSWDIAGTGFLMRLSSYVPQLIGQHINKLLNHALQHTGLHVEDIGYWAIHPGGRKILEAVAQTLQLPRQALDHSYQVLHDYGNMSSPTILFVLQKILEQDDLLQGKTIFTAAFGPGITMETLLLSTSCI